MTPLSWAAITAALLIPICTARADDDRPLSAAQVALFETPHLQNISQPETLDYTAVRDGPEGFTDTVAMHVRQVNPDGTKDLSFDFLTGDRRVAYPELDHFRGNPLVMLALQRDVKLMKAQLGLSEAYFRNHIREAYVDRATVGDTTFRLGDRTLPARVVTVQPFAGEDRFAKLAQVQRKTYAITLSDAVPGGVAEIRISMPEDTEAHDPAIMERLTFEGVTP